MSREESLEKRYGGKEGLKKQRQEWQRQSRLSLPKGHNKLTGFRLMKRFDPEGFKKMSVEAGKKRWSGAGQNPNAQDTENTSQGA